MSPPARLLPRGAPLASPRPARPAQGRAPGRDAEAVPGDGFAHSTKQVRITFTLGVLPGTAGVRPRTGACTCAWSQARGAVAADGSEAGGDPGWGHGGLRRSGTCRHRTSLPAVNVGFAPGRAAYSRWGRGADGRPLPWRARRSPGTGDGRPGPGRDLGWTPAVPPTYGRPKGHWPDLSRGCDGGSGRRNGQEGQLRPDPHFLRLCHAQAGARRGGLSCHRGTAVGLVQSQVGCSRSL